MSTLEHVSFDDHESVHVFTDRQSQLKAFVAIHSTHNGPAAGGVRVWTYKNSGDALDDVLRLSRGMSYKNALAGLKLGGGKAVIMRPSGDFDRAALFAAFGRCLNTLGGKYYTAEDVGATTEDMRVIRQQTTFVAGLDEGAAASGNPSPITADGVFRSLETAAQKKMGRTLDGLVIAVQGLGHVGFEVCHLLSKAGAKLIVTDINSEVLEQAKARFGAEIVAPDDIYGVDADIFSPCALGAVINPHTIIQLKVSIIAGAANNQLSVPKMGQELQNRDILYCPDYVVNAGGIINIAGEIEGCYNPAWVEERLQESQKTLADIIDRAEKTGRTPGDIADEMAGQRIGR